MVEKASSSHEQTTSEPVPPLTEFQYSILAVLQTEGPEYGLGIKRTLEQRYETSINHGRLYPNLDDLAELDLLTIGQRDRRTNEYTITDLGTRTLETRIEYLNTLSTDSATETN